MSTILVPTRGGEDSYPNQDRAIKIAQERGADILFLYVTNVKFLNRTAAAVVVDVAKELDEMGEFLLTMAKERAAKAGVEAATVVQRGEFSEVLEQVIENNEVDALVLGSSVEDSGHTTLVYLEELSAKLATKFDIEVFLVNKGETVSTHKP
ncbi:MAG: universal stress protein [Anaerolineae bacterium]|nr:universal stress protein [Anaerolineae bacterium]